MVWSEVWREFITLLVVVDPVGTLPVFYFATAAIPQAKHRIFILRAVAIATIVLLFFLIAGQLLLEALGLRFGSFQIAGGIILFLFAMMMIFGESKPEQEIREAEKYDLSSAVFPLAIPSIASPGAMLAIVVLTENQSNTIEQQALTAGLLIVVMLITLLALFSAAWLKGVLGNTGASVISRVMGIILATIAIDAILGGLDAVGVISLNIAGLS